MTTGNKLAGWLLALALAIATTDAALAQTTSQQYMNGGIGASEQDAIKAAGKHYNLHLLFAQVNGEYISDVNLDITDATGASVLKLPSAGPMTNVNLPAGKYQVSATYNGDTKQQQVTVSEGKTSNLSWRWGGTKK